MSLTLTSHDSNKVILKSADQYHLWKARTHAACWAATRLNVFDITDEECLQITSDYDKSLAERKKDDSTRDVIGKSWTIITASLHDDLFLKLIHVPSGHIATLMSEIRAALLVNIADDIQPLRLELYGASMQRDCNNDLQTFIAFIIQKRDKLLFLKTEVPDEELIHIFLKGLPSVFQPLQVHFAIPGNDIASFDALVATTRKFACTPIVAAEMAKLKSAGLSQNVFTTISRASSHAAPRDKQFCFRFSKTGHCSFGDKCKFYHAGGGPPAASPSNGHISDTKPRHYNASECSYCHNKGHSIDECRKRAARNHRNSTSLSAVSEDKTQPAAPITQSTTNDSVDDSFVFVFSVGGEEHLSSPTDGWVLDSGATTSATHDSHDCEDIVDCHVKVTAAGCHFVVLKKGTAVIPIVEPSGQKRVIKVKNCLISEKFPYKLLALQKFAKRGYSALIKDDTITISHCSHNFVITASRDPKSKLYFLTQGNNFHNKNVVPSEVIHAVGAPGKAISDILLSRSYTDEDLLWKLHLRHGHRNFESICRQYSLPVPKTIPACPSCVMGKAHIHPFISSGFTRATRVAEGFHSDFRGPFSVATPYGHMYLLTIIDDYSRRIFAFLVKSQSEWIDIWIKFVSRIEAELGKANCISWLLSDNGSVYKSGDMTTFCAQKGIQQRHSAPYSQFMDHTAERNMRTIGEMMTTTMLHANMPRRAWGWAALHATEVLNRTTESVSSNRAAGVQSNFSRLERWKGIRLPTQTKGLYPFGCLAFKLVPHALRTKLDAHAIPCVFLGIDASSRAFLLGTLFDLNVSVSVEVTFFENSFPFRKHKQESSPSSYIWTPDPLLNTIDSRIGVQEAPVVPTVSPNGPLESKPPQPTPILSRPAFQAPVQSTSPMPSSQPATVVDRRTENDTVPEQQPASTSTLRRSTRVVAPRIVTDQRYRIPGNLLSFCAAPVSDSEHDDVHSLICVTEATLESITPRNARDALSSPQAEMWLAAMNREKACHIKNKTFGRDNEPPLGAKVVPADWVLKIKYRGGPIDIEDLTVNQYKARVVIRGQYMQEGLQFNDTFAPVAKPATVRSVFAVAAKFKCILMSGDVETAFLTAKMDCEVWIKLPPFWGPGDHDITLNNPPQPPCLLLKGVPGIPQGSRLFYQTFAAHLLTLGFSPSAGDKCLFINESMGERNAVILWVDDFVFLCECESTWCKFICGIRTVFNVPNAGPLNTFLGMKIHRNVEGKILTLNQSTSIHVLLERAGMTDCNPVPTPCITGANFTKADCPAIENNTTCTEYRSIIAMANFISCWSRPDITFIVNKLCKFMANPGEVHWKHLKHLMRYLAGTAEMGLCYDFSSTIAHFGLHGYTDSSFADCPDTSRSTLAYSFMYDGAILSWYSKLNSYVNTCTNHAEYNAFALGSKEAEWLLTIFTQLVPDIKHAPVPIMVDNSGVVSMVYNPVDHQSNKHVKISCHYSRELVENKIIIPQRIPSSDNLADLFTKALAAPAFLKLSSLIVSKPTPVISTEVKALMITVEENGSDNDEPVIIVDDFRANWSYLRDMKRSLGADSVEINDNNETFSTGRKKLCASFFTWDLLGNRTLISRHDAMSLDSKFGEGTYIMCRKVPIVELPVKAFSTISLKTPSPMLMCKSCGLKNCIERSYLQCTGCFRYDFEWSCACVKPAAEAKLEPPQEAQSIPGGPVTNKGVDPVTVPPAAVRPRREPSRRSWVPKIKYAAPVKRGILYHTPDCAHDPNATIFSNIEFANAYSMMPATCCH